MRRGAGLVEASDGKWYPPEAAHKASDPFCIGADNVTLDLNGHTIDGDDAPGRQRPCLLCAISATSGRHHRCSHPRPASDRSAIP
jgi:hypothetical protein